MADILKSFYNQEVVDSSTDYQADLYSVVEPDGGLGAKKLSPNQSVVDIFETYPWTLSQSDLAKTSVPRLFLTEYRMTLSSEVAALLYTIRGATVDNAMVAAKTAGPAIKGLTNLANSSLAGQAPSLLNLIDSGTAGFNRILGVSDNKLISQSAQNASNSDASLLLGGSDKTLLPYLGLYSIEATDWVYNFPYLGDSSMVSPDAKWELTDGSNFASKLTNTAASVKDLMAGSNGGSNSTGGKSGNPIFEILGKIAGTAVNAADLAVSLSPGAGVSEKPYSFSGSGYDKLPVKFFLYNTTDVDQIKKNWEFCYAFTYQNLPNRKGINLMDPPVLYRAEITGYKQFLLCYVSDLSIKNHGNTRLMDLVTGNIFAENIDDSSNVKMVPEAYEISFTLNNVFMNSRNLFALAQGQNNTISVTKA